MKKAIQWIIAVLMVLFVVVVLVMAFTHDTPVPENEAEVTEDTWKESFSVAGFSEDEIAGYEEMFSTVGITDFQDIEIIENGIMHVVTGKVYDSSNLQFNVTLEDRVIIYMELAGIPEQKAEAYFNWRGKLKTKTVNSKTAVELYSDTEGGYLAVLDWDTKTIGEYAENTP